MTVLGNEVFEEALVERLKQRDIPLRVLYRIDRPTGMAKMDLVDGDKKHLEFHGNAMEEIELSTEDMEFVKGFDIVYAERWAKAERYIAALRRLFETTGAALQRRASPLSGLRLFLLRQG